MQKSVAQAVPREAIKSALESYDQPSIEKSGRRQFDELLEHILDPSLGDDGLADLLSSIADVAFAGDTRLVKAVAQILSECETKKHVIVPLARNWLTKRISLNDAERRGRIIQALTQISAPLTFIELQKEVAVREKLPSIWFDSVIGTTSTGNIVKIFIDLLNRTEIKPELLIARAPSIRARLGNQTVLFFDLATGAIESAEIRASLRSKLNKIYGFGLNESIADPPQAKKLTTKRPDLTRFHKPNFRQAIEEIVELRNVGRLAA